ncbi:MAG: hypothetical protein FWG32_07840 [Oscillospiraceae bacterium]|nr:hypothetical protein [Oscillospiraceae bacterium]
MPEKSYSAKKLKKEADAYFQSVDDRNAPGGEPMFYSWPGLLLRLGLTEEEAEELLSGRKGDAEHAGVLSEAKLKISDRIVQLGMGDKNKAAFLTGLLKQKPFSAAESRADKNTGDVRVTLTIAGVGEQEAFD